MNISVQLQILKAHVGQENCNEILLTALQELVEFANIENDRHKMRSFVQSVMNRDDGLIHFVKELRNLANTDKEIVNKSFEIFDYLVTYYNDLLAEYTSEIFKLCNECISWSKTESVKLKSYSLLCCLIKHVNPFFLEHPDKLLNLLKTTLHRTESSVSSSEKKDIYKLIGIILEFHPEIAISLHLQIFRKLKSELKNLLCKDKTKITELEGTFECLGAYLTHFSDQVKPNHEDLYIIIQKGCHLDTYRKTSMRIALKVMGQHFSVFANQIYNDRQWWYETLNKFLNSPNRDDTAAVFEVLDVFYMKMADMFKNKFDENDLSSLRLFVKYLKQDIRSSDSKRVTLAMKNMGYYASACFSHSLQNDVEEMFTLTSEMAERCCLGIVDTNIELYHLSDLLLSLTGIIRNSDVRNYAEYKLDILGRLCVLVITSYPQIPTPFQIRVKLSLVMTFVNMELTQPLFLESFLDKTIFMSLIKSCSYFTEDDIEFLKEIPGVNCDDLIPFKKCLPLWQDLCNILGVYYLESLSEIDRKEISDRNINMKIFDKFMAVVLKVINKLDLSMMNEDSQKVCKSMPKPKNESDVYIFTNLVEMVSAVIGNCDEQMLKKWIPDLIPEFINHSFYCPTKTGYYQLLTALFKKYGHEPDFEDLVDIDDLKFFVCHILNNISELREADLISSLSVVLNTPKCVVQHILPHMESLFKMVFTLGVDNLWLASEGLTAFEIWYFLLPMDDVEPVLLGIAPYLNLYLDDKKFLGDTDDITNYEKLLLTCIVKGRKNKMFRKLQQAQASSANKELLALQKRIAKFLSQVDVNLCASLYKSKDYTIQKVSEYLKFELPFCDTKVQIFLDKFVPRVIELAINSSDLQTRTVACEFLHSTVSVFIGNTDCDRGLSRPYYAQNLPKNLLTVVIRLGADTNDIIKQMFRPLCSQLARYYSENFLPTDRAETNIFLEILFDGICSKNDAALRYVCAELIYEFVGASIKRENQDQNILNVKVPDNIIDVISRICLFCLLPSGYKKLGAALAFNSIYQDLQEQLSIINIYWIELLYHFVKNVSSVSKSDCDNKEAIIVLKHIGHTLHEKSHIFLQKNDLRKVPKCLNQGTLADVISWLLIYCVSENEHCRVACVNLVTDLSTKLPGCRSLKNYFDDLRYETKCELFESFFRPGRLNREFLNCSDINSDIGVEIYSVTKAERILKWLSSLNNSMDCFLWLEKEKVIEFDYLWNANVDLIESFRFFNEFVLTASLQSYVNHSIHCESKQFLNEKLNTSFVFLKFKIFVQLLNFLIASNILLEVFIDKILHENLWDILIQFIFDPPRRLQNFSSKEHAKLMNDTLACLKKLSAAKLDTFYSKIRDFYYGSTFWPSLLIQNLEFIRDVKSKQYLNGLVLLQKSDILQYVVPDIKSRKKKILDNIFYSLNRDNVAQEFDSTALSFSEEIVRFLLDNTEEKKSAIVEHVAELIFKSDELNLKNTNLKIAWGRHFFSTFKEPLRAYFYSHQLFVVSACLGSLQSVTNLKIQIVMDLVIKDSDSKGVPVFQDLIIGIFENWTILNEWSTENPNNVFHLFDLIKNILDDYKQSEKYNPQCLHVVLLWLLRHLTDPGFSILMKKQILEYVPFFINEENEEIINDFQNGLKVFYQQYFTSSNDKIINETEFVFLFSTLLSVLNKSRSVIVLRYLIYIRATADRNHCDETIQQVLKSTLDQMSVDDQVKFLMVSYEISQNESSTDVKLRSAQLFLIPMLRAASLESVEEFFAKNFKYILETLQFNTVHLESDVELTFLGKQIVSVLLIETYTDVMLDFDCPKVRQNTFPDKDTSLRKEISKIIREVFSKRGSAESSHRKLKCYSYIVFIKIIKKVQRDEKFYAMLFEEIPRNGKYIWKNIVDCEEQINLKMFAENIPIQKKKIIQRHKELQFSCKKTFSVQSISTQCLTASSLIEDIMKFDMSGWTLSDTQYSEENKNFVELEEDIFNNHECMFILCELLNFMKEQGIYQENSLPSWMKNLNNSLHYYLLNRTRNVIMFILKLILNCEAIFRPYINNWLDLIVDCIIFLNEINYFTADLVTMLLSWPSPSPSSRRSINELMKMLISKTDMQSSTIRNYQMELIKVTIEKWNNTMDSPGEELVNFMNKENDPTSWEICLLISKRYLLHRIFPVSNNNALDFIQKLLLLNKVEVKRNVTLLSYEVLALILRLSDEKNDVLSPTEIQSLNEKLVNNLNDIKASSSKARVDLFFSCLHRTVNVYPKVFNSFVTYLSSSFSKFQGIIKSKCLKIFVQCISLLSEDIFLQLMKQDFEYCLRGSDDYELQKSALEMIKCCYDKITKNELEDLLMHITTLSSHSIPECRELIYDISRRIYLKYRMDSSENYSKIRDRLKAVLLNGLRDKDNELQQNNFLFWKQFIENKPVKAVIMNVFEMYSSYNEIHFVCNAAEFLLEACFSTPDIDSKIFDNPLSRNCSFENYQINRFSRNSSSVVPTFVNSLSSQLLTSSRTSVTSFSQKETWKNLLNQASIDAQMVSGPNFGNSSGFWSGTTKADVVMADSSLELKKLRRRLYQNTKEVKGSYVSKNIKRRDYQKSLTERIQKPKKHVVFNRNFRIGDLPDIEIPRSAVIMPLKVLARRDPVIAKLVFTSIFEGILKKITEEESFFASVNKILSDMLKYTFQHNNIFIETIFEIAFNHSEIGLDSQYIVLSSGSNELLSLGALLLEDKICKSRTVFKESHTSKKLKSDQNEMWAQLTELYQSLNQTDVVNGILKEKLMDDFRMPLKECLELERIDDWESSLRIYEEKLFAALKRTTVSYEGRFITEAYFKCAAHLSKWENITNVVSNKFNHLTQLWEEAWDTERTLPWFFTAAACISSYYQQPFDEFEVVNAWLRDEEKSSVLTNLAESLSILMLLEGKSIDSHILVNNCLQIFLENWYSSSLCKDKFLKLQIISEMETMLSVFHVSQEESVSDHIRSVLTNLERSSPEKNHLIFWDKRIMYRTLIMSKYRELLDPESDYEVLENLEKAKVTFYSHLCSRALEKGNCTVARKYLSRTYGLLEEEPHLWTSENKTLFSLNHSKVFLLQALRNEAGEKTVQFVQCVNKLNDIETGTKYDYDYYILVADVISKICHNSIVLMSDENNAAELLFSLQKLLNRSHIYKENLTHQLMNDVLTNYQKATDFAETHSFTYSSISAAYVAIAKHCQKCMEIDVNSLYAKEMVRSILRAMKFDSKEAVMWFPTLLQLRNITDSSVEDLFLSESQTVEEWKFLPWIQQLLAYADTDKHHVAESIISRIMKMYPKAFQFLTNFNLAKWRDVLHQNSVTISLINGLTNVRLPEEYYRQWCHKLSKLLKCDIKEAYDAIIKLETEFNSDDSFKGNLFSKSPLRHSLRSCIDEIKRNIHDKTTITTAINQFEKLYTDEMKKRQNQQTILLSDFSPWLSKFSNMEIDEIEIPGQYSGFSCPKPKEHIKIHAFVEKVQVLNSLRLPVKIKIIGNDGKKYSYLLKCEDGIFQDQRIQQILSVLNYCIYHSIGVDQSITSVMTYGVFPLRRDFGMIEWLEDTLTLDDFMDYGFEEKIKKKWQLQKGELRNKYVTNFKKLRPNLITLYSLYEEAAKKCHELSTLSAFRKLCDEVPDNIFRKSLLALCNSPVQFWRLRNQFISSYSVMCMYNWILGIGDRHLKNTLVCLKTGICIGIDFGYAFGTGIENIMIPELIPFRMTSHIQSIMAPFYLTGLIRETMISSLRSIRENQYLLFFMLQVFILQPASNWENIAYNRIREEGGDCNSNFNLQWNHEQKISIIKQKLDGVNPIQILTAQIKHNRVISVEYRNDCIRLLHKPHSIRISLPEKELTASQLIDCLLDIATDEQILAICWQGQMENLHKQALLEGRAALLRTNESLERSKRTAVETEEIGTAVVQDLDSQTESLLRTRERLVNTDYELSRSRQLLRMAHRTVLANKLLLILIIVLELFILGLLVYVKLIRK